MKLLKKAIHPSIDDISKLSILERTSARAIVMNGEEILLLYTQRYNDYSLPGGGVDPNESIEEGLLRELSEETGAQNVKIIGELGLYEEYRPWYKPDPDIVHMLSYCYYCSADRELGETKYEDYERKNGMKPLWINIHKAIEHNKKTLKEGEVSGLSLEREIFLLEEVARTIKKES